MRGSKVSNLVSLYVDGNSLGTAPTLRPAFELDVQERSTMIFGAIYFLIGGVLLSRKLSQGVAEPIHG
jgi:hypothetical protein